jgi:hypothetical protein
MRAAATAADHVNARFFAAQSEPSGLRLETLACSHELGEVLSRAPAAFLGASFVDLVGALGSIGQDEDLVARDLQEPTADGHCFFVAALLDADNAGDQRGQERRVARQDADDALGARRHNHVDRVLREHLALRGHNLHFQWHLRWHESTSARFRAIASLGARFRA